jgi:hypothetical protein
MKRTGDQLVGGNMNSPIRSGNLVRKERTAASVNIHELLTYVKQRGIEWIPDSIGIDYEDNKHILSYIEGDVPHDTPEWLWKPELLIEVAQRLCAWHNATLGFHPSTENWTINTHEPYEVICHNDFAPYNCVFDRDKSFIGLIDFDTCAPGTRLWDIAYTAYRFVPLLPVTHEKDYQEYSPFSKQQMLERLNTFLTAYSEYGKSDRYEGDAVLEKLKKRLIALSELSHSMGTARNNPELIRHSTMYKLHSEWLDYLKLTT